MKKISDIILKIFAIGVLLCLFAGALSLVGYVAALFIGGETATAMCVFIHKTYFPWVIKFTSVFTGLGLIGMYLTKKKALTVSTEKAEEEKAESAMETVAVEETDETAQ